MLQGSTAGVYLRADEESRRMDTRRRCCMVPIVAASPGWLADMIPTPDTMAPVPQAAWQSRAAMAAAEHQSQQLAQSQAELNALKARLWDSAARNSELER